MILHGNNLFRKKVVNKSDNELSCHFNWLLNLKGLLHVYFRSVTDAFHVVNNTGWKEASDRRWASFWVFWLETSLPVARLKSTTSFWISKVSTTSILAWKRRLLIVIFACWIFSFFPAFRLLPDNDETWQNVVRYRDQRSTFALENHSLLIEFLDAQPSDIERETFEAVQRVLKNSESILEEIQCYKGAGKEIREAISAPTEECQRKAYLTVAPLVAKLKRFYEFSLELGER